MKDKAVLNKNQLKGLVLRGTRNVFAVLSDLDDNDETKASFCGNNLSDSTVLECRLKGKVLKGIEDYYNPLAPGDRVCIETDPQHQGTALITEMEERRNVLSRFNQKGQKSQAIAANIDMVLCMTSPLSPPFRPRFLDRLLVQAEIAGLTPLILCNKWDLFDGDQAVQERLADYERIGYNMLHISAKTGLGLDKLRTIMAGKTSALMGQSGVGKSSLVNALDPELSVKTGAVNEKYNRGNHTTAMSIMIALPDNTYLIDTPGIRRMIPDGITKEELAHYMKEFAAPALECTFGLSCSHRSEPGCKILQAVCQGHIHKDRYESFLNIGDDLADKDT